MARKKPAIAIEQTAVDVRVVKVRVLPNGQMNTANASRYSGFAKQTLAQWRSAGRGPPYVKVNGRIYYLKPALDTFLAGEQPST